MLKRKKLLHLNDDELNELLHSMHHTKEMSVLSMSKELSVSRDAIIRWMAYFDIPLRSGSEANKVRFARMDEEQRKRVTEKAIQARKGSTDRVASLRMRALSVSGKAIMSEHEKTFAKILIDHDLYDFIFSYPEHIFNIDFAFPLRKVAIEVDGGNWHATPRKQEQDEKKEEHLRSQGWKVLRWSNRYSASLTLELIRLLKTELSN